MMLHSYKKSDFFGNSLYLTYIELDSKNYQNEKLFYSITRYSGTKLLF